MTKLQLVKAYGLQVLIAVDQLVNALIPPITGTLSYADETLSARAWRAWRDGRLWGKVTRPVIDRLFFWQRNPGHCERSYLGEMARRELPPAYRRP